MGLLYEASPYAFAFITVMLGGATAFMTGRATAKSWNPLWQALLYVLPLAAAVRFLHWGLFYGAAFESWRQAQGTLLSLHYYVADSTVLSLFAAAGFYLHRAKQMARQYPWAYTRAGLFSWRKLDATK